MLLFVAGMADNVLKPLMLGRGVDAPMPVILLGALGGMATAGILGMFVGATLLALGYQIFMGWVRDQPGRRDRQAKRASHRPPDSSECCADHAAACCRSAVLGGCLLLGACTTVGPDFERPEVPWLAGWRAARCGRTLRRSAARPSTRSDRASGGATSTTRCSTSWSPRRSA